MLDPYPSCESCFVHDGAYKAVKLIKESTWGTIKSAMDEYPDYKLISTGHSVGGGVSILLGVELAKDFDTRVTIVSHAALKIRNPQFSDYVDRLFSSEEYLDIVTENNRTEPPYGGHLRTVHIDDVVPLVSPTALYAHSRVELYINKLYLPQPKNVTEIKGLYTYTPIASDMRAI